MVAEDDRKLHHQVRLKIAHALLKLLMFDVY